MSSSNQNPSTPDLAILLKVLEDQFALVRAAVDQVHAHLASIDGDGAVIRVSDMRRFLSSAGLGSSAADRADCCGELDADRPWTGDYNRDVPPPPHVIRIQDADGDIAIRHDDDTWAWVYVDGKTYPQDSWLEWFRLAANGRCTEIRDQEANESSSDSTPSA